MALNFGSAEISVSSSNRLRPWNIYEHVKFAGIEESTVKGKQDPNAEYKVYDFKFSCPDGTYTERIFEPNEKSIERRKFPNAHGHESEVPSDFERIKAFAKLLVLTFNPAKKDAFEEACGKISTFADYIKILTKVLANSAVETKLKLAGRNSGGTVYAALPTFVRINSKTGECFISEPFIGDKVAWNPWEFSKKQAFENATPTNMSSVVPSGDLEGSQSTVIENGSDAIADFESLL